MQRSGRRALPPTRGADSLEREPRLANEPAGPTAQPTPAEIPLDDRAAQIEERVVQRVTRAMDAASAGIADAVQRAVAEAVCNLTLTPCPLTQPEPSVDAHRDTGRSQDRGRGDWHVGGHA